MRTFGAAILATSLLVTSAFAAPLQPGKPAGVKKAQDADNTNMIMIVSAVALAGVGIGLAASSSNSNAISTSTNSTFSTSGTTP